MELTLKDMVVLPTMLPREGNFETLIIIGDIQKKTALTQKDIVDFEITSNGQGGLTWNEKGTKKIFKIDFTEIEIKTLGDVLKKLSEREKLTVDHLGLYKLFIK